MISNPRVRHAGILAGDPVIPHPGSSLRQRGWPQPVNEAQDLSEQGPWDGDVRHPEGDVAAAANDHDWP